MSAEPAASKPEKPPKRTLLQKYDIPVQNLDFDYIRGSHDAREIEHIYAILKSGQEGHFPDLTQCAEKRLRELNPHSRALRVETPLLNGDALPKQEWNTICGELNVSKFDDLLSGGGSILLNNSIRRIMLLIYSKKVRHFVRHRMHLALNCRPFERRKRQ